MVILISKDNKINFSQEALRIIPITQYDLKGQESKGLNHGFNDLPFFPNWQDFLNRSSNTDIKYQNYMAYLLCKLNSNEIIGVLAVQLIDYESLQSKVLAITPKIKKYLYLSWIALDINYQNFNYFVFLFEYYHTLIRRFRNQFNERIEGATITIRRMRPLMWSLFNNEEESPTTIEKNFIKDSPRFKFIFVPLEQYDPTIKPSQDHLLMLFKTSR